MSLSLLEADTIKDQPGFDVDKTTVILVHGYTDSVLKPIGQVSMQAYLDNGNYNALFLDWGPLAGGLYTTAVANVVLIAQVMAVVLLRSGISFEKLHLVGHSLGGQMVGMIGANVQELTKSEEIIAIINRITGLDPAGPLFYEVLGIPLIVRQIQPTDAAFVDCIHSDAGLLGEPDACGFIDFWPNGGTRQQPDCPFVPSFFSIKSRKLIFNTNFQICVPYSETCSHKRSWEVFVASLLESDPNSFLAVEADSYLDFQFRDVTETATYNQMGINCSKK